LDQAFESTKFYSRQTVLTELGAKGQEKLRQSKVAVIGLGGLGSVSALYLALAGVGKMTLVDRDTVELTNLHRQVLYSLNDLRYPKVEAAARRIQQVNPDVKTDPIAENLESGNVESIIAGSDCVVDGLDNMETRYIINRYCVKNKIPFVFGGAIGMEGNVAVFKSPQTPCLECVLPGLVNGDLPTCDTRGVLGATTGIVGSIQAIEAIKVLADIEPESAGRLLIFDFARSDYRTVNLTIRPDCDACQVKLQTPSTSARKPVWLCGSDTVNVSPEHPVSFDMTRLKELIGIKSRILLATPLAIVFDYDGHEISLFKKGRMLIKNVQNEDEALRIFQIIMKMINAG
jgi:molybdopterin/thiamine biosynthesis adenylyltransferase